MGGGDQKTGKKNIEQHGPSRPEHATNTTTPKSSKHEKSSWMARRIFLQAAIPCRRLFESDNKCLRQVGHKDRKKGVGHANM